MEHVLRMMRNHNAGLFTIPEFVSSNGRNWKVHRWNKRLDADYASWENPTLQGEWASPSFITVTALLLHGFIRSNDRSNNLGSYVLTGSGERVALV